ncbi:MAG: exo-beta-N-acetylmuramidase NamZ domain-containing protein [Bacteroidota bacterium]
MKQKYVAALLSIMVVVACSVNQKPVSTDNGTLQTGAEQMNKYLGYLKGKRVAMMANQTTVVGNVHLVDTLRKRGINIVKVFGPEHGFRGNASAGAKVADEVDSATGIPLISLYGGKSKPSKEDLADVDVLIYDLQDVGCRFYTNINALAKMMEACADNKKELLILDRPNPNGYFIDGPILDMKFKSGIGQFPIPITHGLTIGEFATMLNGEGWLANGVVCPFKLVPVANYRHSMPYTLPVRPSPNLNTQQSIILYPSLCLFEGTIISQGRGTYFPFTILGSPKLEGKYTFSFTPTGIKGMAETPLHMNQTCYGLDLRTIDQKEIMQARKINLQWMMELYRAYPEPEKFFDYKQSNQMGNIDKLAGVAEFKEQIKQGISEDSIRRTWEPGLQAYRAKRAKYLIYPD